MAKEEEKQEKEKETGDIQLVEVPTQVAPAYKLPDGSVVGMEDYLVWIGNLIYKINKNTG